MCVCEKKTGVSWDGQDDDNPVGRYGVRGGQERKGKGGKNREGETETRRDGGSRKYWSFVRSFTTAGRGQGW